MNGPTVALYVRIPLQLHERLESHVNNKESWRRRGLKQETVISALEAFLAPVAMPAKTAKKGKAK